MPADIEAHEKDGVLIVRIDRPQSANAMTPDMAIALRMLLSSLPAGVRAILLTGLGQSFCSGMDLGGAPGAGDAPVDAGHTLEAYINPLMTVLRDLDVPLVTAIRGPAAGIGAALALMGDLIVMAESGFFLFPFARIGLIPDGGAPWLLARTAGRARAMELMLLGEKLPAATALQWGMANRIVADEALEDTAFALARRLADGPGFALGLTRRAAWAGAQGGFGESLALERLLQRDAGHHPDFAEGVAAFRERRPARFARSTACGGDIS
jgi:2-(1,2-epoxy-1,2-dihydrophenyl)acetyl-CoA isomerase